MRTLGGRSVRSPGGPAAHTYERFRVIDERDCGAPNCGPRSLIRRPGASPDGAVLRGTSECLWTGHQRERFFPVVLVRFGGGDRRAAASVFSGGSASCVAAV